ncbi:hypothetical protein QR98_0100190 [Sarcoptes scabiei]|uniref:Uncharacterized protein n=1 Tax=Sarcoptes scabiei TaxID=52283 RepID=A0A132AKT6_SARSC|nr:hypothetical protein QR98_0100190 [Sarcoptes scabiei]
MTIFEKITLVNIQRSYGHDETSDKPTNILTHIDPKFIKRRNNFTQFISFALIFFILKANIINCYETYDPNDQLAQESSFVWNSLMIDPIKPNVTNSEKNRLDFRFHASFSK